MNQFTRLFLACLLMVGLLASAVQAVEPPATNPDLVAAFDALQNGSGDNMTKIRYMWRNDETWYARWKMLHEAKRTIDCTYFIIDQDVFGQAFLGMLAKKAREGVKIRLMCDWRIAHSGYMKGMIDKMQDLAALPNIEIKL